jgi:hypothetical protein
MTDELAKPAASAGFAVVYGIADNPAKALAEEGPALRAAGCRLSPRLALIEPGTPPLMLNSRGWANLSPQAAGDLAGPTDMIRFCRWALESRTPLFARPIRLFIQSYLDFVENEVERQRLTLETLMARAGLSAADDLPTYRDWMFSALLALPNAHVACSLGEDQALNADAFARVDILFWTGREILAVLLEGLTMATPEQARRLARLKSARADLRVVRIPAMVTGGQLIPEQLREQLTGFWHGLTLPFGLFRAPALAQDYPFRVH